MGIYRKSVNDLCAHDIDKDLKRLADMVDRSHDYILLPIEKDLSVVAVVTGSTKSNCKTIALISIVSVIVVACVQTPSILPVAVLDMDLQRKIESVVATCPFSTNGCDWNGNVPNLEEHKRSCLFSKVTCPKGCGKQLLKKEITAHSKANCISSFARCSKCYIEMTVDQLQTHECPCERYTCPDGCGKADMSLEELRRHRNPSNGQCSSLRLPCQFKDGGCSFVGSKRDMEVHLKKSEEHTQILTESFSKLKLKQKATEDLVEKQAAQLKSIQESFCQYAILLKEFETRHHELREQVSQHETTIQNQASQIAEKDAMISELRAQIDECSVIVDDLQHGSQNGTLLWKVCSFREQLNKALSQRNFSVFSPVIYTSKFGYKLCAQLFPAGSTDSSGKYMSIYFHLLPSDHDDVLRWPFSNKISFTLIDQADHPEEARNVSYTIVPAPNASNYQKPNQKMSEGRGCHQFLSLQELESRNYIRNDSIFIKIKVLQKNN
eukprot:gene14579-5652_t